MNVFLTGATGFIGGRVLHHLLAALGPGDRVHCLTRRPFAPADPRVVPVAGDLERIGRHAPLLCAAERVIHVAGNASFSGGRNYEAVNVAPVAAMVAILRGSAALRRLVYVSSIGAVDRAPRDRCDRPLGPASPPHPRSAYGRSKRRAEEILLASGLPCAILRPAWVWGKGMRADSHLRVLASLARRGAPASRFDFPGRVSLIHVDDLARALAALSLEDGPGGEPLFAATESLPLGEILAHLRRASGAPPVRPLPCPPLAPLVARLHRFLPIPVANLFVDYLRADETPFRARFAIDHPRRLADRAAELFGDGEVAPPCTGRGAWLVTGANSGIGLALARALARRGEPLILVDRSTSNLSPFSGHLVLEHDLARPEAVRALADAVRDRRLRCLVNNAGIGFRGDTGELDPDRIRATLAVNAQAPVLLVRLLLDRLRADGATIINVSSSSAHYPLPGMSVYAASKAFLQSWSEALAVELSATNRVVTVCPAGTATNFQAAAGVRFDPAGRGLLTPEHVAGRILAAAEGGPTTVHLGAMNLLLLLLARLLPRPVMARLTALLFRSCR